MHYQTLSDDWQIRPLKTFRQGMYPRDEAGWQAAVVPGHWQQLPGLEQHHGKAVYRCRFAHPEPAPGQRQWLRLAGVFYRSRPYLNGVDLGAHEGYFIPQEVEVTGLLKPENALLVEVDCPEERNKLGKTLLTGVFSHWDCLDPQANPGGIWLPVELHASGSVRLSHARLLTSACDEHFAQIRFDLDLDAAHAGPVVIRLRFAPHTFAGPPQEFTIQRELTAGMQRLGGLIKLREPRLWWTHDLGRPDLYTVTVELVKTDTVSDSLTMTFGVRTFELRQWIAYLNGERFLIKGNNYPPGDMRIATMNPERYAKDFTLARDCHINMLRVHAHIEHPAFYAAANEAGILLWQDFPLQWVYAHRILPEGLRQVRAMVRLLGSHPALAIWCMHNEAFLLEDTADERWFARVRTRLSALGFSWNRDVLDTQLKAIAEQEDSTRPVVRSSGEFHMPYVREGTDCHAYFGWYRSYGTLATAEMMQRRFPSNLSFVTEFGAQSFPNLESSQRFMPDPLTPAAIEQLEARHGFQGEIMAHWLPWRAATALADVVDMSQDYQILINRFYIDRLRDRKYRPTGGIIAFLFVDSYPAVLWSVVDYWRVPKRSYYALRRAFSPQYIYCIFFPRSYALGEAIHLPISVVNDARRTILGAQIAAQLHDPTGKLLAETRQRRDLPADCAPIIVDRLRLTPTVRGCYTLHLQLTGVDHEVEQIYAIDVA
ncbi:MAG: glycoside hydrolase [Candidatus Viridilinea halotolerans]|uniref:beta-mannosidase n=1 Tax=Candidatus Viridilinea halotolerans TaxID=2491704 RepID=A0A426TRS9_9CHLR|nr:MAG: glycoside hydrolase [Candidatus Viridilinea halotolerans]